MLVECPNCHRRYEPKPNEKYCPCCGEEIKEPLKNIEPEPKAVAKEEPVQSAPVSNARRSVGRALSFAACILGFLTFVFLFGPAFRPCAGCLESTPCSKSTQCKENKDGKTYSCHYYKDDGSVSKDTITCDKAK